MNNGQPVVPRSGYIVEFNALWYNTLRFTASMERECGNEERAIELEALAEKCKVHSLRHSSMNMATFMIMLMVR